MNDNYATTNTYAMKSEAVKVDEPQPVDTWYEKENNEWQEIRAETEVSSEIAAPETEVSSEQPATPLEAVVSQPVLWLKSEEVDDLQSRWKAIQIEFVDEPRKSVEQADALVVDALKQIGQAFTNQRVMLNERWLNHEDIQTEDLRISLQSYRSFLNRILAL